MRRVIFIVALCLASCDVNKDHKPAHAEGPNGEPGTASLMKNAPVVIPLSVAERGGVPRAETVTSGIPLPKGMLESEALCRVTDENNTTLECEKSALARWPDGSVKWLLLDFPLRLGANETRRLALRLGEAAAEPTEASPLRVESDGDRFVVHTGALRVNINRREFTVFDEAALSSGERVLAGGGGSSLQFETTAPGEPQAENWLVNAAGGPRETARAFVQESEVEFQNAQRVVIRVGGIYATEGGRGVGKTHQLLFDFSRETPDAAALTALAGSANEPLRAFAEARHYSACGAFGVFHPVDDAHFPRWEAMLRLQLEYVTRLPGLFHWDGLIAWGDTLLHDYEAVPHKQQKEIPKHGFIARGYDGWLNNDTNIAREMLVFFLRSQDQRLWEYWERMVMHVMDVDTVHGYSSPQRIGAGRRHDQQHWGSVLCGYGTAAVESSDYYYLTGSMWGREMALKYADWYLRDGGTEWPTKLAAIARAHELTGKEKYRKFLQSPACLGDPQLLKLGSGQSGALDKPNWRTAGTETGVDLLWQLTGEEK